MHCSGITDLSRGKKWTNKQKNLLLCFGWRSKQQQVFTHTLFTKENGTRPQKSHVLMEQPNFQRTGGTRCCTRYSQLKAGGNSDQPQVFLCIIYTWCHNKCCCLSTPSVSALVLVRTRQLDRDRPTWFKWLLLRPSRLNVGPTDSKSSNLPLKAAMCKSNFT